MGERQRNPDIGRTGLVASYGERLATGMLPLDPAVAKQLRFESASLSGGTEYFVTVPLPGKDLTLTWVDMEDGSNRLYATLRYHRPLVHVVGSQTPQRLVALESSGRS